MPKALKTTVLLERNSLELPSSIEAVIHRYNRKECANCGRPFLRLKSLINDSNNVNFFCSLKCANAFNKELEGSSKFRNPTFYYKRYNERPKFESDR